MHASNYEGESNAQAIDSLHVVVGSHPLNLRPRPDSGPDSDPDPDAERSVRRPAEDDRADAGDVSDNHAEHAGQGNRPDAVLPADPERRRPGRHPKATRRPRHHRSGDADADADQHAKADDQPYQGSIRSYRRYRVGRS